jgi:hypothetical protein
VGDYINVKVMCDVSVENVEVGNIDDDKNKKDKIEKV